MNELTLFALHLPDLFLPLGWCLGGMAGALALVFLGCWRMRDEDVPRVGLLTAAFFVSSAIHVPLPPSSAHLLLNGLVGAILGVRAGVAIFVGLLLQAALLGHGGWTTLGLNTLVMALPALTLGTLFRTVIRLPGLRGPATVSLLGGFLGSLCVLCSLVLQSMLVWVGNDYGTIAAVLWLGHLPLAAVEGLIVACTVGFLVRVKPEMLGWVYLPDRLLPVESATVAPEPALLHESPARI